MYIADFFLLLHIYLPIETELFCFTKISYLQPFREIMGGQQKRLFRLKNSHRSKKWICQIFCCCCASNHRDETFLFLSKFHIFSRLEKSWGNKKMLILAEKIATGRKNDFVGFFFGCASNHRDETFLFLSKFHIFCLQRNYGGTK